MKKQDVKKLIEGKSIQQIEAEIETHIKNEAKEDRLKIEKLYALQDTKRYRENSIYKNLSFGMYLYERWHMRQNTFDYRCKAYFSFPEFSMKYNPGLTEKIIKECTPLKAPTVISAIAALERKRKKPLKREDIEKIIDQNRKPKKPKADVTPIPDWRIRAEKAEKEARHWKKEAEKYKALYEKVRDTLREMTERFESLLMDKAA